MTGRSVLVLGLLLTLTAACTGGSHHASVTIRGTMFMIGNGEIPVNGTVVATDETKREVDVVVHGGAFSIQLAPGTYKFVGRTPQWNGGIPCPSVGPITFVEPPPQYRGLGASVSIVCPMR